MGHFVRFFFVVFLDCKELAGWLAGWLAVVLARAPMRFPNARIWKPVYVNENVDTNMILLVSAGNWLAGWLAVVMPVRVPIELLALFCVFAIRWLMRIGCCEMLHTRQ